MSTPSPGASPTLPTPSPPPGTPPPVTSPPPPVTPPPVTPPPVTPPPVTPPPVTPPPVTPPPVTPPPVTPPPVTPPPPPAAPAPSPPPKSPPPPVTPAPSPPPASPPPPVTPAPSPPPSSPPPPVTPAPSPPPPSPPPPVTPAPLPPRASPPTPVAPAPARSPPPPPPAVTPSPSPPPPPVSSPPPPDGKPQPSPPPPPPPVNIATSPPPSPSPSGSPVTGIAVGVAVTAVVVLGVVGALIYFFIGKRRRRRPPPGPPEDLYHPVATSSTIQQQTGSSLPYSSSGGTPSHPGSEPPPPFQPPAVTGGTFSYEDLAIATDGFSDANLLGQGGFGHVYKGTLNEREVAIKKLRAGSGQGEREFRAEVEIISRVHHKNLVSLVGYCIYGEQRLLVYECIPNKTLEFHLHGSGRPTLDWPRRWKIALGSAKGLAYLHEDCHPKIIHRDIKAANILLDYNFEPKVADFGLAKFQSGDNTHVSTRVMGTFGYLAPEYATTGKVNDRSDVFSFGVMLLELITGRRPVMSSQTYMDETLVAWARPLLTKALDEDNYEELIDPRLETNYDAYDMQRLIACAAAAVRQTARSRPRMSQIVRYLEGEISMEDLNAGIAPGQSALQRSGGTTDQVRRLRRMAFGPRTGTGTISEYASSEFSEPTSEYGQNPSTSSSGGNTGEIETQRLSRHTGGETDTERTSRHTGEIDTERMSRRTRGRASRP